VDNFKIAGELLNKGAQLLASGKVDRAIVLFKYAIKIDPKLVAAHFNLGLAYQKADKFQTAITHFKNALKFNPDDLEAKTLLAENYYRLGNFQKAIYYRPSYPEALTNLGAIYARMGQFAKALTFYQRSLECDQNYPTTYTFLGNTLLAQGNMDDAVMCYKMAIEKDKKNAEAYNNLGTAYARLQKYGNAVRAYKKVLSIDRNSESALTNLAMAYASAKKTPQALKYFKRAYSLFPENGMITANLFYQMREAADWNGIGTVERKLNRITDAEIAHGIKPGEDPFVNVIRLPNSKKNFEVARSWSRDLEASIHQKKTFKKSKKNGEKLNIGYLSAHFHNHPTSHLISKLFELHDRNKFNIFVYSVGPDDGSIYYKKIRKSCDKFTDLYNSNFSDSAVAINKDKIDILVDLDGYTDNNKLQILALKPAPIQIAYLGFPGTTGAKFIDYIIADKIVIPRKNAKYFSEKIIYLPVSYQVNDNSQEISSKKYARKDFGLPEGSFVFASFNGIYKIEPKLFDIWMNILKRVPNGTLWLLKTNDLAEKNLRNEARKRGINPNRLIFTERLAKDKHLARLALADLALDTFTCNGHTSTSDALWAGVPVVTLQGKHFASRVSSSLLTAVGLPGLITHSPKEYEGLAVSLAKNPQKLNAIHKSLFINLKSCPLFNTERFAQNLEVIFNTISPKQTK
jgi:protein O-GlcNAc transferase